MSEFVCVFASVLEGMRGRLTGLSDMVELVSE